MTTRIPAGNTFHGLVEEFPGLCIDKFNQTAKMYLLSHCHSDHLIGLENRSFNEFIYCSETTKRMLAVDLERYLAVLPLFKPLEINRRHQLLLDDKEIYLTLIPTLHCAGSTMFLVESDGKAVLLTGDMRAEPWWTDSLRSSPFLFPYTTKLKTLDNIYFDSTFSYRGEPYIDMITNSDGIAAAVELLSYYPRDDPDIQFIFQDSCLGFDDAWAAILSSVDGSLHCNDAITRRVVGLLQCGLRTGEILQQAGARANAATSPRFHACGKQAECFRPKFPVRIKQSIDFNIMDFAGVFCPLPVANIGPEEREADLELVDETSRGNKIYKLRQRYYILPKHGDELLPADIKLVFSRHSSFSETQKFISLFGPRQVHPCTYSKVSWMNGVSMERLFGTKNNTFDLIMTNMYGQQPTEVVNRPVSTINRWLIQHCEKEQNLVRKLVSGAETKFQFMGQFQVSRLNEGHSRHNYIENRKEVSLHKFVVGRRGNDFRGFIEEQQNKYAHFARNFDLQPEFVRGKQPKVHKLGGHTDSDTEKDSSKEMLYTRLTSPIRKRPCLVRVDKPSRAHLTKSQIRSSFPSMEVSFWRASCRSAYECRPKSVRLPVQVDGSIYCRSQVSVDTDRVVKLAQILQSNANSWLGIQFECD